MKPLSPLSPMGQALNLNAPLQKQVADETEEQRRLRLQQMQQQRAVESPAASLLGLGVM